jgi:crotonobetainyl-CoA:carnitine CoA-transferase CaiB-like acyl-CoA transferase
VALAGAQAHVAASTLAAASSLIALHRARATGRGQHVDVSVLEAVVSVSHICGVGKWLDDGMIPRRSGTGLFASVPSGAYRCRDGLVYLMVNRPAHWQALARWIHEETGNEEVLDPMFEGPSSNRIPYRELLDLFISELTERHPVDAIYREGQRRHIAFTPVNTATAVCADAHLAARGFFAEASHATAGRVRMPGAPYRHGRTPWRIGRPAPRVGEHNAEILGGELGVPARTLASFEREAIL